MRKKTLALLLALTMVLGTGSACSPQSSAGTTAPSSGEAEVSSEAPSSTAAEESAPAEPSVRVVTDMAGREVELPAEITSIATFGSIGVINAFVELMGYGDKICNDMAQNFTKTDQWAMQYEFAPQMKGAPILQNADGEILIEDVLALEPDLCLVMSKDLIEPLEDNGLNVIYFEWKATDDVKTAVTLLGEALNQQELTEDYLKYFDDMVAEAEEKVATLAENEKKTVLYGRVSQMNQPHVIAEWWMTTAGGISVTADAWKDNDCTYSQEDLLLWNPDVILDANDEKEELQSNSLYSDITAIKTGEIYQIPTVAHVWGNRTVEQPLTVFWAMNKLYPELETTEDLAEKIHYFYEHFFLYDLSDEQIADIIG